jgi:hypothetical protein
MTINQDTPAHQDADLITTWWEGDPVHTVVPDPGPHPVTNLTHEDVRAHHAGLIIDPQPLTAEEQREADEAVAEWRTEVAKDSTIVVDDMTDADLEHVLMNRRKVAHRQGWAAAMDERTVRTEFTDLTKRCLDNRKAVAAERIAEAARTFRGQVALWDIDEFTPLTGEGATSNGTSRMDDLTDEWASQVLPVVKGTSLKMKLAQAGNRSTFEGYSGHIEQAADGHSFHRGVADVEQRIGDLHQRENGEWATMAVAVSVPEYISPDGVACNVRYYAIDCRKRPLPGKKGRQTWHAVHGGSRVWRNSSAWIYEPIEMVVLPGYSADEAEQAAYWWHTEIVDVGSFPELDADEVEAQRLVSLHGPRLSEVV